MLDKLLKIKAEYEEITQKMGDPSVVGDQKKYQVLAKKEAYLRPIVELIQRYEDAIRNIDESETILREEKNEDLLALAKEDLSQSKEEKGKMEEGLKIALLPKDPNDDKNVIMEIRAGAGGEEASLFAQEISRMYMRYAESVGLKTELINKADADAGGVKEIIFRIIGDGAYSKFKYESGVHRVQRIPVTESQGRIHTSAATVAVLPEAEDVDLENSEDHIYDRHIKTYYKKSYVDRIEGMFPDLIHLLDEPLRPVLMVDGSPLRDTQGDHIIFLRKSLAEMVTEKNREMFEDTGHQLKVTNGWRPHQQQAAAYALIKGTSEITSKGGACARPGNSYHQIGLAFDVSNWPTAAPYLGELGMVGGCSSRIIDDQGHFSLGEMSNADAVSKFACEVNPTIGSWSLKAGKLWRKITK